MTYVVSITSQGQISIPASLRRKFGFNKTKKAFVSSQNGKLTVEPVKDFLDLYGAFQTNKRVSSGKIRNAFELYLAEQATNTK